MKICQTIEVKSYISGYPTTEKKEADDELSLISIIERMLLTKKQGRQFVIRVLMKLFQFYTIY